MPRTPSKQTCIKPDCSRKHHARGLCKIHYDYWLVKHNSVRRAKQRECIRRWQERNREKYNQKQRERRRRNPELTRLKEKEYFKKNPEVYARKIMRGRLKNTIDRLSTELIAHEGNCELCQKNGYCMGTVMRRERLQLYQRAIEEKFIKTGRFPHLR